MTLDSWLTKHKKKIINGILYLTMLAIAIPMIGKIIISEKKYNWQTSTYGDLNSKDAFGAYYLDKWLEEEWSDSIIKTSDYKQAISSQRGQRCNYLFLADNYSMFTVEFKELAKTGNNAIYTQAISQIAEQFKVKYQYAYSFYLQGFKDNPSMRKCVPLEVKEKDSWNFRNIGEMWIMLEEMNFNGIKTGSVTPLMLCNGDVIAAQPREYKGKITLLGTQAFFSNYGVSRLELCEAIRYIIDETFDRSLPLVVVYNNNGVGTGGNPQKKSSMFYVLRQHEGTALALWILLITLFLTLLINGRRRRRAEDAEVRHRNSSINYIEHVASIYDKTTNFRELLFTERLMLLHRLRREYRFNFRTRHFTLLAEYAPMIAEGKSLNEYAIRAALTSLDHFALSNKHINEERYLKCLKDIDELGLRKL